VEIAGHDPGTKAYFFANFLAISSTILGRRSASTLSTMLAMELGSEPSAEAAAAMVFGFSSDRFAASTVSFAGGAADRMLRGGGAARPAPLADLLAAIASRVDECRGAYGGSKGIHGVDAHGGRVFIDASEHAAQRTRL